MNKFLKVFIWVWTIGLSMSSAIASSDTSDYIINLKGEKQYGTILRNFDFNNAKSISFDKGNSSITEFFPEDIIGFGLSNGRYFLSKELPKVEGKVFVQVVLSGVFNLIEYQGVHYVENSKETVELRAAYNNPINEDGKTKIVNIKPYASTLGRFMSGKCEDNLKDKLRSLKYNEADFIDIISKYHSCVGLDYIVHVGNIPLFQFSPFIIFGVNHLSNFPTSNNYGGKMVFDSNLFPMGQVGLRVHSFRKAPRFSFDISIGYIIQNNTLNLEDITGESISTGTETYNSSSFIIPVFLNYSFIKLGKVDPYFGVGFTYRTNKLESVFGIHDFTDIPRRTTSVYTYSAIDRHGQTISPAIKIGGNVYSRQRFGIVAEIQFDFIGGNFEINRSISQVRQVTPVVFNELSSSFLIGFRF